MGLFHGSEGNTHPDTLPYSSISGKGSCICPVAETRLDVRRPLISQLRTTGGGQSGQVHKGVDPRGWVDAPVFKDILIFQKGDLYNSRRRNPSSEVGIVVL